VKEHFFKFKKENKLKILIVSGLVMLLCAALIMTVTRRHAATQPSSARNIRAAVDVKTVQRHNLIKRVSLSGQTVPLAQVDIAAKYQGKVVEVDADLGQQVAAGQTLIVEDLGDADIALLQNEAAYHQAAADAITSEATFQANYDKAKADYQRAVASYNRYKSLYEVGGISRDALETSEQQMADAKAALDALANQMKAGTVPAAVESARAAALKAQQSIQAVQKQREDLVLRAPWAGVVSYRQVEVGAMVQPGQKLMTLVDNSKLYVDFQVSEQDLAGLSTGMPINVQIDSLGRTFPGKIIYISPANSADSQTFSLRAELTGSDPALKGGMFARAVIETVLRPNALTVPKEAVLQKNGKYYVFVINAENIAQARPVEIGLKGDQETEILSGLKEGERVAVSNQSRLRDGLPVNPQGAP